MRISKRNTPTSMPNCLGESSRQAPCTDKLQIGTKDEELFPPVVRQLEGLLVYGVSRRRRLASIEIERSLLSPEARLLSKAWIKGASRTPLPERQQIGITFKTFTNSQDNIHFPYQMQLLGEAVMDLAEDEFVKYSSLFHDTQVAARPTVGPQLWQKYQKKTPNDLAVWVSPNWDESLDLAEYVMESQLKVLVTLKREE